MSKLAANRKPITENMKIVLFDEVNGICPKCTKPLMKNAVRLTKLYEIAHIYPHSPLPKEVILLENEERLGNHVDDLDNLVPLCKDCHKIFDHPRTVAGYREMVAIKKELQRIAQLKNEWYENSIDKEINSIIESLSEYNGESTVELSLEAIKIDDKADSTLHALTKIKVRNYVRYFYNEIKHKFSELDKIKPYTSDTIYSQVKTYYFKLKKLQLDQDQIFKAMASWVSSSSGNNNIDASEIFVSFFIQNCEIYP